MCLGAVYWAGLARVYFAATRSDAALAGFDDQRIYTEACQPVSRRTMPFVQLMREDAAAVLRLWLDDPEREQY
jgi:guanine deaminase